MKHISWPRKENEQIKTRSLVKNIFDSTSSKNIFYEKSDFLCFKFKLNHNAIKPLMPIFLRIHPDQEGIFFVAKHRKCEFSEPYLESGILIKVNSIWGSGYHFLWAVVDSEIAMILGRETLGVPKKMADIIWDHRKISISVDSHRILDLPFHKNDSNFAVPYPVFGNRFYNVGGIGNSFLFQPIWSYSSKESIIKSHSTQIDFSNFSYFSPLIDEILEDSSQLYTSNVFATRLLLPSGFAGPYWFNQTYFMRYARKTDQII